MKYCLIIKQHFLRKEESSIDRRSMHGISLHKCLHFTDINIRLVRYKTMPKTINNNQLTPDATYLVRGQVGFSRISRPTTDKEREDANRRRTHKIDKNYTTMSIYNAQVLARNPQAPTLEERYAAECLYKSSSPNYPGNNFTAMNKSKYLPKVGVLTPTPENANNYVEIIPEGELAAGLDVTLVMRVFKGQGNNGVTLDRVLVNEPIRYYGMNSAVDQQLNDFGITFTAMAPARVAEEPVSPVEDDTPETTFAAAPTANNVAPVAAPAPAMVAPAPVAAPAGNPFTSYAPNQNVAPAAAPAAPAEPVTFGPGTRQY